MVVGSSDEGIVGWYANPVGSRCRVVVGDVVVWGGDVNSELQRWRRRCALAVADLWDCPPVLRRYLETGDAALQSEALRASHPATCPPIGCPGAWAAGAAYSACRGEGNAGREAAVAYSQHLVLETYFPGESIGWADPQSTNREYRAQLKLAHLLSTLDECWTDHAHDLRRVVLQIDSDERVLSDALLSPEVPL